jgi:hypothetical protein
MLAVAFDINISFAISCNRFEAYIALEAIILRNCFFAKK